jgi:hypothetical protein
MVSGSSPPNAFAISPSAKTAARPELPIPALEDTDALLRGANARTRSGTWHPAAAKDPDDYAALGASPPGPKQTGADTPT